jgi:hypothetical protein
MFDSEGFRKWRIWRRSGRFWLYRVGDDALDRILEILQEDDDDEDAEFEGFLPDYQRDLPLNFQNFEFDLQPLDLYLPEWISSQHLHI